MSDHKPKTLGFSLHTNGKGLDVNTFIKTLSNFRKLYCAVEKSVAKEAGVKSQSYLHLIKLSLTKKKIEVLFEPRLRKSSKNKDVDLV